VEQQGYDLVLHLSGGPGLRVILTEKRHGGSRFEAGDGVFYFSVYLRLL